MLVTAQEQKIRNNVYLDATLKQAIDKKNPILIDNLDIEPVYPNNPDYKLIQEVKNEDTISLDEFMKL